MRRDWIQKCFDSVLQSTIRVNIIAIDNGSTDGSIDFINQNYPNIDFIVSKENLGFGKANNIGLEKALKKGGDYFFLLNQDAWVAPNTIEELAMQAEKNPQYGVISPMHLNGKGDALDYSVSEYYLKPSSCPNLYSDSILNKIENKVYEIKFINAAAWLLTKKCVEVVGGFSPTFYHYGEDENYCHRIFYKKMKVGIYPLVNVYHDREHRNRDSEKSYTTHIKEILITCSNPDIDINIDKLVLAYVKNAIQNITNKNFKLNKNLALYILDEKKEIINNKKLSKSNIKNIFL